MKKIAIILAAGIGSRLKKATAENPKCLLKINNKTILENQIDGYSSIGVDEIVVVTGHMSDKIKEYCKNRNLKISIIENKDYLTTNNMYSLNIALDYASKKQFETYFISNADCIYEKAIFDKLSKHDHDSFAGKTSFYLEESMKAIVENNKIVDIAKTITEKNSFGVTLDLYKLSYSNIKILSNIIKQYLNDNKTNLWTEVALKDLLSHADIKFCDMGNLKWYEIDNSYDYVEAIKLFTDNSFKNKKCGFFDIDGTLFLGDNPIEENINIFKDFLNNKNAIIVTNNTSKIHKDYVLKFKNNGINIKIKNVITPLDPLRDFINNNKFKTSFIIANKKVTKWIKTKTSLIEETENPELMILTYDNSIDYGKLSKASEILFKYNPVYVATHEDAKCPTAFGFIPDIGTYINTLFTTTQKKPAKIFGKPNKDILSKFINKKLDNFVFFGDRLYTDFQLAKNCNIDFVLCLSGETKESELYQIIENGDIDNIPQFII